MSCWCRLMGSRSRHRSMKMAGFLLTAFILVLVFLYGKRLRLKYPFSPTTTANRILNLSSGMRILTGNDYEVSLRYWELMRLINETNSSVAGTATTNLPNLWRPELDINRRNAPVLLHRRNDDRILAQLVWGLETSGESFQMKNIYLPDGFGWWYRDGWQNPHYLTHEDCPGNPNLFGKCSFSEGGSATQIDAVVTAHGGSDLPEKLAHVLRFYYLLESPLISSAPLKRNRDLVATYYRGADVVTPYEKWVYYDPEVKFKEQGKNYSQGKSKMAAMFASNCYPYNNRMGYVRELQKHVEVDVFGGCGTMECSRSTSQECFNMLSTVYRFYLSFENANCRDYATEKLFVNGFGNYVIPIVLGAHPLDYQAMSPEGSYIHVEDFSSPKELATYMKHLADNPEEYNSYFRWKGTGRFINTKFFCRICAMVHYADKVPPPDPPNGSLPQRWGMMGVSKHPMCLPGGAWYWSRNNSDGEQTTVEKENEIKSYQ